MKLAKDRSGSVGIWVTGIAVLALVFMVGTTAAKRSSDASSSAKPHLTAAIDFSRIVYPMEITVSDISLAESNGQYTAKVTLVATNNLGLEPTYANAKVYLQNLILHVSYPGSQGSEVNTVLLSPVVVLNSNGTSTFMVSVGSLQLSVTKGTSVVLTVTGSYSYMLVATTSASTTIQARGTGLVPSFESSVVA